MEGLNFVALYNDNGQIIEIKPYDTALSNSNKIEISEEIANMIISGQIGLDSLEIKITADDRLSIHVINRSLSSRKNNLLYKLRPINAIRDKIAKLTLVIDQDKKLLIVKPSKKEITLTDDEVIFLITSFNDPNEIYEIIKVNPREVIKTPVHYNNLNIPSRFDIYTRRTYNEYQLEII